MSGCPTNNFLSFLDIFYPPNFARSDSRPVFLLFPPDSGLATGSSIIPGQKSASGKFTELARNELLGSCPADSGV